MKISLSSPDQTTTTHRKNNQIITIKKISLADSETWDRIYQQCSYATYFHSREWSEIWRSYTSGSIKPTPKLISFSDGKTALIPLLAVTQYKGLLTRLYMLSMDGGFGGWISPDPLTREHTTVLVQFLTRKLGKELFWRLNPYDELVFESGVPIQQMDYTHAINLPQNFTSRYTTQSAPVRKARKAEKAGVTISLASSLEDWQEYYQVYQSSLQRWGEKTISEHPWEFFAQLFHRNSPNIKLWLARYENRIAGGALCFYSQQHVVYWHGAGLAEFFHVRPVNLLMYTLLKDSYEQGYTWFDFYPSGGMEGVIAFKESLGATPLPAPIVHLKSPLERWKQQWKQSKNNQSEIENPTDATVGVTSQRIVNPSMN